MHHRTSREGVRRLSVAQFLIALVALIVVTPFVEELPQGPLIESILITVVLLTGVFAVGGRRRSLLIAGVLVIPAVAGAWLHHAAPHSVPRTAGVMAGIVFSLFVIGHLIAFIMRAGRVNSEVLCAAIATYLMLGVVGAMAYELVWRISPESFILAGRAKDKSFDGFEALYFSFSTLAPINDNDVLPRSNLARMLVMVQATVGMLYMGMLIARLVGIYSNEEAAERG